MSSKNHYTDLEKEMIYTIVNIKESIKTLEHDVTKIHQNLKRIAREINDLSRDNGESFYNSDSESSSSEETITIVERYEKSDSDYTPCKARPEKKICKVKYVKKKSGIKKTPFRS
jgi:hypothetical protein